MHTPAYSSEELGLFTKVLDHVCRKLQVIDDEYRTSLGKSIMFKAQTGERCFQVLADYACQGRSFDQSKLRATKGDDIVLKHRFSMIDPAADRSSCDS